MSWPAVVSLSINWDTVSMSVSGNGSWFYHVCLPPGPQTEPCADGPYEQMARSYLRTIAPDAKALVLGHKRSNCRVVVLSFERGKYIHDYYVISGVPSLDA